MNDLPSPTDPTPRGVDLEVALPHGEQVEARVDHYSDRVRCDHPDIEDGRALGEALAQTAAEQDSGRVVVLARPEIGEGLADAGYRTEAVIPNFYAGAEDCAVMGLTLGDDRGGFADPAAMARVEAILEAKRGGPPKAAPDVDTVLATSSDAARIAELIADTFEHYPTPSGVPEYIAEAIEGGVPFRYVTEGGEMVACASADLVPEALTAELTDCATLPSHRGQGLMRAILFDLMGDLRGMGYPTAFTLARARIPGINVAFQRLGFELRGTMLQSCRIGTGLEDMHVWSRDLGSVSDAALAQPGSSPPSRL